ncbi:HD domain-containing protein [Shewanella gelidii]|uniref:Phosphohydrolase n=1 Tax=Shewanella gelidii TaxID=1642821 RepID=A0A917NAH4_9GAMM|nr:HD domain-containing protein [Shewanella gelidii]MCL1097889.1 HD domain-containing protein [Shewanella gelidii]GGI77937.1 phosphohydrolase [Shewanella gelidii]
MSQPLSSMWDPDVYQLTWQFASQAHLGQTLPSSDIPYINHLGNVAMEVLSAISIEKIAPEPANLAMQCALLHDTIEDTPTSYQTLVEYFGESVADGVLALTKNTKLESKQAQMRDSLQRLQRQPKAVGLVKLADRITNLQQPPAHWDKDKAMCYREEAQLIHQCLHHTSPYLALRLQTKIDAYAQFLSP